jgi:primosomal protein N' (replication factor Y)
MFHAGVSKAQTGHPCPAPLASIPSAKKARDTFRAMAAEPNIYQIAVPSPLFGHFDYLPPREKAPQLVPGMRVRVPFGRGREVTGIVLGSDTHSEVPRHKLKRIAQVLDEAPVLPAALLALLRWAADYYHYPLGEVLATALPAWLREGRPARLPGVPVWSLTDEGRGLEGSALARAPVQRRLWEALAASPDGLEAEPLGALSTRWREVLHVFKERGWVTCRERAAGNVDAPAPQPAPALNAAQSEAIEAIAGALGRYQCFLLHGITGSGKTEVYLGAIERVLALGRQVLVLVPEIGLTPQLVERFWRRLGVPVAMLHSGLTDTQRFAAWSAAAEGKAPLVLGTRSAVFTPIPRLGLIVVDEEHDASYKQQDGFRYSARDLAVLRAAREKVPIALGSATPSLESLKNARDGGYRLLELPERPGVAELPVVRLLDLRKLAMVDGLTAPLRAAVAERLKRGEQSLLFLNRRGFAPVLMCYGCGWVAPCRRCDARLTYHQRSSKLICHHCGAEQLLPEKCPTCQGTELHPIGEGTERLETALAKIFPQARLVRIDRDSTAARGALEDKLKAVHEGRADILVGTQMLTKGHDFPNVTLVGVVNADQGLYSAEFRAPERLFQQILQVAGRAGRADKPGEVLIQTWHPDHPLFTALVRHDFNGFADYALAERREADLPPYSHLALLRAESPHGGAALAFLRAARAVGKPPNGVQLMDPVPSPMARRAGRWRAQLLVQSSKRAPLHEFLDGWVREIGTLKEAKRVRWSLDVDPGDLY